MADIQWFCNSGNKRNIFFLSIFVLKNFSFWLREKFEIENFWIVWISTFYRSKLWVPERLSSFEKWLHSPICHPNPLLRSLLFEWPRTFESHLSLYTFRVQINSKTDLSSKQGLLQGVSWDGIESFRRRHVSRDFIFDRFDIGKNSRWFEFQSFFPKSVKSFEVTWNLFDHLKSTVNKKLASYSTSIYLTCYLESFVSHRWILGPVQ